jgi:AcrR family transcriptional regulator
VLLHGCSNRSKRGRPPAPAEQHAEPHSAAGVAGAAGRTRRGAERRARTTSIATRERILDAALELFSELSFEGASTRDIAARAGVGQPLLSYHFKSKDELWRSAADLLFAELNAALGARIEELRGVDDLTLAKLVVREFVSFSAAHPQLHRIILQECKVDGPRIDWLVDRHIRPVYQFTEELLAGLVERGEIVAIPPAHLYYIITGAGATIFTLAPECRRLAGFDPSDPDPVEVHMNAIETLLFGRS